MSNLGIHLARQLEELGVESAHFVGHDFGGAFAIFGALYSPMNVGSMTLLNSGVMRGYRWHRLARLYRSTDQKGQSALIPQLRIIASLWPGLVIFPRRQLTVAANA